MIPYLPNDPDTYRVPPELAHIMVYDKDVQALRLISSVTAKEVRNISSVIRFRKMNFPFFRK